MTTRNSQYGLLDSLFLLFSGPNIANFILTNAPFNTTLNLKGIASGNAVIRMPDDGLGEMDPLVGRGGKDDLDMYWGKGLVSNKLYKAAYKACGYPGPADDGDTTPTSADAPSCSDLVDEAIRFRCGDASNPQPLLAPLRSCILACP